MLAERLYGNGRSPGDVGLVSPIIGAWYGVTPNVRYMTISTLSGSTQWNSLTYLGPLSGTGDGYKTLFCRNSGTAYYGYMSFLSGSDAANFGFTSNNSVSSALTNGSNDLAVFTAGYSTPSDYINMSSSSNAVSDGNIGTVGGAPYVSGNGVNDRGLRVQSYGDTRMSYWTISTRSNSSTWGNGIDGYGMYPCNPVTSNDVNNRVVWANGVCGEGCSVTTIRYTDLTTIGSCTKFGDNTFSTWSPYALSNGINDTAIFGGGAYTNQGYNSSWRSYIKMSTPANATSFANLEILSADSTGACSNARL